MFRRFHFSSAGLESANAAHERYYSPSDEHERRWISPDVRCISGASPACRCPPHSWRIFVGAHAPRHAPCTCWPGLSSKASVGSVWGPWLSTGIAVLFSSTWSSCVHFSALAGSCAIVQFCRDPAICIHWPLPFAATPNGTFSSLTLLPLSFCSKLCSYN